MKKYKITSKRSKDSFIGFFRFKRIRILWKKWRRSLDKSISMPVEKMSQRAEKSMRLWKMSLKDPDIKMSLSSGGERQIERDNLLVILRPINSSDYLMTVMPISEVNGIITRNLYEIRYSGKNADVICESFDVEMSKRMEKAQNSRITFIEGDLDRLILQTEEMLKDKIKK
jgi:hypothetical protein